MADGGPTRRRFLSYVLAAGAVGIGGGATWVATRLSGSSADSVAATTTSEAVPTTIPARESTTTSPSTTAAPTTTTTAAPAAAMLDVICREAWGARPAAGEFALHSIERLTVHHTAVVLDSNAAAPARARQHQQFHQDRGWPDLAYHFLVDANGNVYEGRPVTAVGDTGTDYDPTGHFLVCCEGDFTQQEIPDAQLQALADMLAWAAQEFGVSPDTITGHRDWAQTSCPGDDLYEQLEQGIIKQAVVDRIGSGGIELAMICDDEGLARIADVEAGLA